MILRARYYPNKALIKEHFGWYAPADKQRQSVFLLDCLAYTCGP